MVNYRRTRIPGGTWFFTVTLEDRRSSCLVDHVDLLRQTFRRVRARYSFTVDAIVILPDHLHTIWSLPPGDTDYSGRWRYLKGSFTRNLTALGFEIRTNPRGEHALWARRYWEHLIVDDEDYARHVDYIHANPVKHGYVLAPGDWAWSSFHTFVREGRLSRNWMSLGGGDEEFGPVA